MQLYVIYWSFQNAEDQLFATKEFCGFFKGGKFNQYIEGFELNFIAHTPQDGTGVIICKVQNRNTLFDILNMWRENFSISFDIKPALTSEELFTLNSSKDFGTRVKSFMAQ